MHLLGQIKLRLSLKNETSSIQEVEAKVLILEYAYYKLNLLIYLLQFPTDDKYYN